MHQRLVQINLAEDNRPHQKLAREDLLPLGSRIRVRQVLDAADKQTLSKSLIHLISDAGNANLMTPELAQTMAETVPVTYDGR